MENRHEKGPCTCGSDCGCGGNDDVSNQASVPSSILGSINHSDSLWTKNASRSSRVKWVFLEEEEMKDERKRTT